MNFPRCQSWLLAYCFFTCLLFQAAESTTVEHLLRRDRRNHAEHWHVDGRGLVESQNDNTSELVRAADLGSHAANAGTSRSGLTENCQIFALWNYPHGVPYYVLHVLESWRIHTKSLCGGPILINDTNIQLYIPDLPNQYWYLPDNAAKSDVARYALLYHHGGIYMDTDMFVAKDLDEVINRIQSGHDLVSYSEGHQCEAFSSNFMAAQKGSALFKDVWTAQKELMQLPCSETDLPKEKVCCTTNRDIPCHVPWAGLGERVAHPILQNYLEQGRPLKKFCYAEEDGESFNPKEWGNVIFNKPKLDAATAHFEAQGVKKPFDRVAYHLFNSQGFASHYNDSNLFDPHLVIGSILSKTLLNNL